MPEYVKNGEWREIPRVIDRMRVWWCEPHITDEGKFDPGFPQDMDEADRAGIERWLCFGRVPRWKVALNELVSEREQKLREVQECLKDNLGAVVLPVTKKA